MKVTINFEQFQTADDGNTTNYGGTVKVNDTEVQGTGTDREFSMVYAIADAISPIIGRELNEEEFEKITDALAITENVEIEF